MVEPKWRSLVKEGARTINLRGHDAFTKREIVSHTIAKHVNKSSQALNIKIFDEQADFQEISNAIRTPPVNSQMRVVVVTGKLKQKISHPTTVVIGFNGGLVDADASIMCSRPSLRHAMTFVRVHAKRHGLQLSQALMQLLIESCNFDLDAIITTLKKLSLLGSATREDIISLADEADAG